MNSHCRKLELPSSHREGEHCGSQYKGMRGGERKGEDGLLLLSKKRSTVLLSMSCLLKPAIMVTNNSS